MLTLFRKYSYTVIINMKHCKFRTTGALECNFFIYLQLFCSRGEDGMTALHMAALGGFTDCCRTLIGNGCNVNSIDCNDRTPLHCAACSGSQECLQLLLRQGQLLIVKYVVLKII